MEKEEILANIKREVEAGHCFHEVVDMWSEYIQASLKEKLGTRVMSELVKNKN